MAILNNEGAIRFAKEFTTSAIENEMIVPGNTPEKTAENVYAFYKTLYENFSGKKQNS